MESIIEKKQIEAERKKEDAKVTKLNEQSFHDKNIEKVDIEKRNFRDPKGNDKEKVIEHVTYHNGVVKSRLTGMYKNKKVIYTIASKSKKKGK
jgi:hypothetical protein